MKSGMRMDQTLTARMWLMMLRSGDKWTTLELAGAAKTSRDIADKLLRGMSKAGYIEWHRHPPRLNGRAYSVTVRSRVPAGIPLALLAGHVPECAADAEPIPRVALQPRKRNVAVVNTRAVNSVWQLGQMAA
jgi:hypothetical protein